MYFCIVGALLCLAPHGQPDFQGYSAHYLTAPVELNFDRSRVSSVIFDNRARFSTKLDPRRN